METRKKVISIKKETIIISFSILIFALAVVAASFFLGTKSMQQNNQQVESASDHHQGQPVSDGKFNSLLGQKAPNFTLNSYDDEKVSLSEIKGKKVVLFFTEGVMCYPACWNQIAAFGKDDAFKGDDTAVLTIVIDTKNQWESAVKKMPDLVSPTNKVLFDSSKSVSNEYGVLSLPSSMHKGQYPGHTYLILDKEGIVRFIKDDPQMAVRNDELKAELEKLN
ncbi:hypothetical protein A2870_03165 [Candidatus Curtissbacteria bacterium RIFCSPHIGHO2_01_FULL_41_11]|uniref:Thioredoxin domain-containing protein n=1 Tax=Candidatus Curtissbacteria bacterium RIFCSPHIGHO2_01_FULL_41_11 TaxID=1797711 RepID=A0A1F5G781_9BACT|nr:MAG: hypothetical protein A2870_03165 [Candidatus Curtissbacteria bacterium RIFCSPHIGHO2_01_FULL_41_11]